mmetsp:Transcript_20380/g.52184  ORF Transcript_20380/g.52184 Transcript_20380/m.52184 type:complete len:311 (-) Transcript_20380:363-1295(-)
MSNAFVRAAAVRKLQSISSTAGEKGIEGLDVSINVEKDDLLSRQTRWQRAQNGGGEKDKKGERVITAVKDLLQKKKREEEVENRFVVVHGVKYKWRDVVDLIGQNDMLMSEVAKLRIEVEKGERARQSIEQQAQRYTAAISTDIRSVMSVDIKQKEELKQLKARLKEVEEGRAISEEQHERQVHQLSEALHEVREQLDSEKRAKIELAENMRVYHSRMSKLEYDILRALQSEKKREEERRAEEERRKEAFAQLSLAEQRVAELKEELRMMQVEREVEVGKKQEEVFRLRVELKKVREEMEAKEKKRGGGR